MNETHYFKEALFTVALPRTYDKRFRSSLLCMHYPDIDCSLDFVHESTYGLTHR
jgi:hypothetical protein